MKDEAKDITCFVIGPIGDKDADPDTRERITFEEGVQVLEEVIEPACRGYGITVLRSDRLSRAGEIPDQVFRYLRDTHIVVADLTGANPNVMYELGLRHTTGKITLQLGERGRLPFDIAAIRTILFKRSEGGLVEARRRLSAAIGNALESGTDAVSATRVWFETPASFLDPDAERDIAEAEEPGFLEKLADMLEGMQSASATLESIEAIFAEIGLIVTVGAAEINAINATGGPASARVAAADRIARALTGPAERLGVLCGNYSESIERMNPGVTYALAIAREPQASPDILSFAEKVRETVATGEQTLDAIAQLRQSALAAGEATRTMRRVNRSIASSLTRVLETRRVFIGWKELLPGA